MPIAVVLLAVTTFFAPPAGTSVAAAKKIEIIARTNIDISVERGPDGTLTPEVVFSSSNPRCLSAERFPPWRDGHFNTVGSVLWYRGGSDYFGSPPDDWLSPTSRPTPGTYVWKAVWPGSTPTVYHLGPRIHEPIQGTVAEATGGYVKVWAGSKRFATMPFKVKYWRGDTKIKLTCPPATKLLQF